MKKFLLLPCAAILVSSSASMASLDEVQRKDFNDCKIEFPTSSKQSPKSKRVATRLAKLGYEPRPIFDLNNMVPGLWLETDYNCRAFRPGYPEQPMAPNEMLHAPGTASFTAKNRKAALARLRDMPSYILGEVYDNWSVGEDRLSDDTYNMKYKEHWRNRAALHRLVSCELRAVGRNGAGEPLVNLPTTIDCKTIVDAVGPLIGGHDMHRVPRERNWFFDMNLSGKPFQRDYRDIKISQRHVLDFVENLPKCETQNRHENTPE